MASALCAVSHKSRGGPLSIPSMLFSSASTQCSVTSSIDHAASVGR